MSQDDKKLFTDRRWTDPPKATVIGHADISEEELKEKREMFLERLRKNGALKDDVR